MGARKRNKQTEYDENETEVSILRKHKDACTKSAHLIKSIIDEMHSNDDSPEARDNRILALKDRCIAQLRKANPETVKHVFNEKAPHEITGIDIDNLIEHTDREHIDQKLIYLASNID